MLHEPVPSCPSRRICRSNKSQPRTPACAEPPETSPSTSDPFQLDVYFHTSATISTRGWSLVRFAFASLSADRAPAQRPSGSMASGQGFAPHNLLTDDTVQKFLDEIYKKKRSGVTFRESYYERRDFIPGRVIGDFFDCDREDQLLEVDNLVTIATKQAAKRPNTHSIARKCPKVFTILITIGRSEFIDFFLKKEGLLDKRLPFTPADERLFPKLMDNTTFFEEFYEKQWEFCAEPLSNNLEPVEFNGNRILPIIHLERVDKHQGSSAWVHKIEVHEDYDELEELAGSQQVWIFLSVTQTFLSDAGPETIFQSTYLRYQILLPRRR